MRHAFLIFLCLTTSTSPLQAQDPSEAEGPRPGQRVRISYVERPAEAAQVSVVTGAVVDWDETAILVDADGTQLQVRQDQIEKVEISLGERSKIGTGAWIGALTGLAVGVGVGVACASGQDCAAGTADGTVVLGAGLAIAALGTGIGAGIGATSKTERWEEVEREKPAEVGLSVGGDGSLRLILSFRL